VIFNDTRAKQKNKKELKSMKKQYEVYYKKELILTSVPIDWPLKKVNKYVKHSILKWHGSIFIEPIFNIEKGKLFIPVAELLSNITIKIKKEILI
jgi:hypothetical protein